MGEPEPAPLDDLSAGVAFFLREPVAWNDPGPEATLAKVRHLTHVAHYFNTLAVAGYGGRMGSVREEGLVEQVVAAAFQTFEGFDPHPDPFEKAAMLLRGITQGHPFTDGNKRTGFLLASYYLEHLDFVRPPAFDRDAVVEFCLAVSAGHIRDVGEMAAALRTFWNA